MKVRVLGGGLAGSEAAWYLANCGIGVELWEMRPEVMTPAHHTELLGELVCSNSLRAISLENAAGLLKEEMRILNSLIIRCAQENEVPAGGALAVDREGFARCITSRLEDHPNIKIVRQEAISLPEQGITIIATGPLSADRISRAIKNISGEDHLYFFDAAAPIVTADSIDMSKAFKGARYEKGEAAYINCPLSREQYMDFYADLLSAERHMCHDFEKEVYFEGCMPVEVLAQRGEQTLLFGPMKPVGLVDPGTGRRPFAVVQLRQDNREGTLFNMVGFQTNLKWGEQKRVFSKIPALENAEFVRFGVMHRNTFINSPKLLNPTLQFKQNTNLFFAGQLTGVEGYIESASTGIVAGINAVRLIKGRQPLLFPENTAIGALCHYITSVTGVFQPMNINFGLLPPLQAKFPNKKERARAYSARALKEIKAFKDLFAL